MAVPGLGSALLFCETVFGDPTFTTSARKVLDAIRVELAEATGGFLRYRGSDGSAPAAIEDVGEIGVLLLAAGEPGREEAVALGRQLLKEYIDDAGRLLQRPRGDGVSPVADVGDDIARAIVFFLAELARVTGDEVFLRAAEQAFQRLRSSNPPSLPAALGLAAEALLRAGSSGPASN